MPHNSLRFEEDIDIIEKKKMSEEEEFELKIKEFDTETLKLKQKELEKIKTGLLEVPSDEEVKKRFFSVSKKLAVITKEIGFRQTKKNAYLDPIPNDLESVKIMKDNIEAELNSLPRKTVEVMVLEKVLLERLKNVNEILNYLHLSPQAKKQKLIELQTKQLKIESHSKPKEQEKEQTSIVKPKESFSKSDSPIKTKSSQTICDCSSSSCNDRHICYSKCPKIDDEDHCKTNIHRCPKGKSCTDHKDDIEHKLKYYHVCQARTGTCKYMTDPIHLQRFSHECPQKNCTKKDKLHQFMYTH